MPISQLQPRELRAWLDDPAREPPVLLDVREPWEVQLCVIPGALPIPMNSVPQHCERLDPQAEIVVICHHGARSMQVAGFLARNGFENLYNLAGGVDAWARQIDPSMAVY
jgi:rhodanese-related sulfurtransferase